MADGVELATAYVTLVPSLKGATKSIQSQLGGIDLTKTGKEMGRSLADSMAKGLDSSGLKKYEQAVKSAERSVTDAMSKSADATKQVEVAQKRLAEAREKYGDDSSQAAQAELDLTRAQRQAVNASTSLMSAIERLGDAQTDLASATERAGTAAKVQSGALASLGKTMTSVGSALEKGGKSLSSIGSSFADMGDKLTSRITVPLATAAVGIGAFALSTASAAETTEISFTTMLGSAEAATEMMGTLADFAAHTPFELSGLQDATRQLLAYGFTADEVVPMLTAVGDATAALGTGQAGIEAVTRALGQMQTRGKVSSEEMLQLTEQGIPAWQYLAEAIGTDTAGAMEKVSEGAVDAATGIKAVTEGMEQDFGGMMDAQSKTIAGLMSNLTDAIEQPLMELRNSDAYAALADSLSHLVDAAGPFVESLLPMMEDGLSAVADVVDAAADGLEEFADMSESDKESLVELAAAAAAAGPAMSVLGRGMKVVGSVGEGIGSVLSAAGKSVTSLSDKMLDLATAPATATTAVGKLAGAIGSIPVPAAAAAVAVGTLLVTGIIDFVNWSTQAEREAQTQAEAMQVLANATETTYTQTERASEETRTLGERIAENHDAIQQGWQDIADLGKKFEEIDKPVSDTAQSLGNAWNAIRELAGQSDLTTAEQGRLKAAVDSVNASCGTTYTVAQDAGGAYQVMSDGAAVAKDEIYKLIDAQIQQAKVSAQTQKLEEIYSQQMDAADSYARSLAVAQDAEEEYQKKYQEGLEAWERNGGDKLWVSQEEYAEKYAKSTKDAMDRANSDLENAQQKMEGLNESAEQLETQIGISMGGVGDSFENLVLSSTGLSTYFETSGKSMDDFVADLEATGISVDQFSQLGSDGMLQLAAVWDGSAASLSEAFNQVGLSASENAQSINDTLMGFSDGEVATSLQNAGLSIEGLAVAMDNAGISSAQLNEIGSANFTALAANAGGDIDRLVGMLSIYNSAPIYDKNGNITADTTQLVDGLGNIYTWNGTTLTTKSGMAVVDASSLELANDQVLEWNEQGLPTINGTAMAQYQTLELANGEILTWNGTQLVDQKGNVYVEQQELYDALGNAAEWNGTTLNPIQGTIYCDYSQLTGALAELDKLPKTYTSNVYINTIRTTTTRTVSEGGGTGTQAMSLSAYSAAPAQVRTLATMSDAPTPVYAAGDDGIARPVALAAASTGLSGFIGGFVGGDASGIEDAADALRDLNRQLKKTYGITEDFNPDKDDKLGTFVKAVSDSMDELESSTGDLQRIGQLFDRAGVQFSDGFVSEIVSGEGIYADNLEAMCGMTDEQLQAIVDLFDQSQVAERVVDLTDALASDEGLSKAFSDLGLDVEDVARDLAEFGLDVEDVTGKIDDFASSVSNGFSRLSRFESDVTVAGYEKTLRGNIKEAKWYAEQVEKVFSQVADYAGADAFRQEVLEGGISEWGRIIQELSGSTRDKIIEVIDLYNEAAQVGVQTGTSLVSSLVPQAVDKATYESMGRQVTEGMADGIADGTSTVTGAVATMCSAVESEVKSYFGIASPSKLMRSLFGYVGEGAAMGLLDSVTNVSRAARSVDDAAMLSSGSKYYPAAGGSGGYGGAVIDQTINFNQPVSTPYQMAREMRRYATYGLAGSRR